jgi:hypothetical protein
MRMVAYRLNGFTVYAPDYSVPGTAEAVAREIDEVEASEHSSSVEALYRAWQANARRQQPGRSVPAERARRVTAAAVGSPSNSPRRLSRR